jgi:hypothetical protein
MLQEQIPNRIGRLELQWQNAMRSEDTQEHPHLLLNLLHSAEALVHSCAHPGWDGLALLVEASALGRAAFDFLLGNPLINN